MIGGNNDLRSELQPSGDVSNGSVPRVLVVEDNRDSRDMVRMLLVSSQSQLDITAVETAAEALVLDAKHPFDLYVLDIWLPGMDGLGLCRRLRERGRTEPIVFFSAMVQPTDRQYVMAAGANANGASLPDTPAGAAVCLNRAFDAA